MAYSVPERATLFALMAQGRQVTNKELKEAFRIDLKAASRTRLNRDGLIISAKHKNKGFAHELTDKGWAWVRMASGERPATYSAKIRRTMLAGSFTLRWRP